MKRHLLRYIFSCRANNITSLAVGVGNSNKKQLEDIAGDNDRVFKVKTFNDLINISHDISDTVCAIGEI